MEGKFSAWVLTHKPCVCEVDSLLNPYLYDALSPYMTECSCVGLELEKLAIDFANRSVGTLEGFRFSFMLLPELIQPKWVDHIKPWTEARQRFLHNHEASPKNDCPLCNGSGQIQTTYNPQGRLVSFHVCGKPTQLPSTRLLGVPKAIVSSFGWSSEVDERLLSSLQEQFEGFWVFQVSCTP